MPLIVTADRAVASVTATESEDWQVVSTPTGFRGITSADFSDNDKVAGFVIFENGEDYEVYDTEDDTTSTLLEITNISGTVTISRPATPYKSSNGGERVTAGAGTHTLVVGMGAGTAARLLRETNPTWLTFSSGDATPSVAGYRLFKTNGTTAITAFDGMEAGKLFYVQRGNADIVITDGANIECGGANITLTATTPSAVFMEDNGVAVLVSVGSALPRPMLSGGTVAADGNNEITVEHGRRYTLTASDSIAGVIGLSDGEFCQVVAPASGTTTLEDEGTTTSGQSLKLSGADKIISTTDEAVYTLTRVGSNIRLSGGASAGGAETVASTAALTALSITGLASGDRRYVNGQGLFTWDSSDLSTEVGYDDGTTAGVYLPPDSDATGASGCWVREEYLREKIVRPEWFGAAGDATTDDQAAFQDCVDFMAAVGGTGLTSATPPPMMLSAKEYNIASTVVVPAQADGFAMFGHGKGSIISTDNNIVLFRFNEDMRSTGWPTTDHSDATPFDSASTNTIQGVHIENVFFVCGDLDSTASCALLLQRVIDSRIVNCRFKDWLLHVDCHRPNRVHFMGCRWYSAGRTTNASLAHLRLIGLYDSTPGAYTPGGGVHVIDCEFDGERSGTAGSYTSLQDYCILLRSVDGIYISNTHFTQYDVAVSVNPSGEEQSNTCIDVRMSNCYFDNVATGGRDFELEGTVDAGSKMHSIHFDQCYFRGANEGNYGFVGSVDDGGSFDDVIERISFSNCQFRGHQITGVNIIGSNSSKVEFGDVKIDGCLFDDGRHTGAGGTSGILYDGAAITVTDSTFLADDNAPNQCISINTTGESENDISIIVTDNDFSRSNYSSGYMQLNLADEADRVVIVRNNVKKAADTNIYLFESDARGAIEDISGYAGDAQWSDNTNNPEATFEGYFRRDGDWCHFVLYVLFSSRGTPTSETATTLILKDVLPYTATTMSSHFPLVMEPSTAFGSLTDAATPSDDNLAFNHVNARVLQNSADIVPRQRADSGNSMTNLRAEAITATTAFIVSGSYPIAY